MREGDGKINKGGIIKGGKGSLKGILSKDKKVHWRVKDQRMVKLERVR